MQRNVWKRLIHLRKGLSTFGLSLSLFFWHNNWGIGRVAQTRIINTYTPVTQFNNWLKRVQLFQIVDNLLFPFAQFLLQLIEPWPISYCSFSPHTRDFRFMWLSFHQTSRIVESQCHSYINIIYCNTKHKKNIL